MGIKMDTILNDGAPRLEVNDGYKYSLEIKIPDPNNAGKTVTKRIPFLVDWDDIENKPNFTTSGNVIGPDSSTNNAVAVFDGVTGTVIKNSAVDDGERENIAHMAFHLLHLGTDTGEYSTTFFLGTIE